MFPVTLLAALLCLVGCATTSSITPEAEPRLRLSANPAKLGESVGVRITGLEPNETIQIRAERAAPSGWNRLYRAEARFVADESGVVDLATHAPVEGGWTSADINGLFWSMRNTGEEVPDDLPADHVPIEVIDERGRRVAAATLVFRPSDDSLVETSLDDSFPGTFILRKPGERPMPAIVVLGGSEGNDLAARRLAPMLADRGYAAVGFPYYAPGWPSPEARIEGLSDGFANLALDRLEALRDTLRARPDIDGDRIGLHGTSKGAEYVLAAASRIEGFSAVAAIVPSDVIWEGWGPGHEAGKTSGFSWRGEPLPFVPYLDISRSLGPDAEVAVRVPHAEGRERYSERVPAARIRVEDIDEPVFLLAGGRDQTWDSGRMAANIAASRSRAGRITEALIFARAGHGLSEPPEFPASEADARARAAGWPAMLAFFDRNLRGEQ